MAYPVANSQLDTSGTGTTTLSFTPTIGNVLVVLITIASATGAATPSDSKSNTYVSPANSKGSDATDVDSAAIFYAKVTATGAGIVLTHAASGGVIIAELAGLDPTTPFNIANNATAQNTAATLSLAATGGGQVVAIGGGWSNGAVANTPGGGYSKVQEQIDDVSNERTYLQIGSAVTAGTITFNYTVPATGWVQAAMAMNIASPGGGATVRTFGPGLTWIRRFAKSERHPYFILPLASFIVTFTQTATARIALVVNKTQTSIARIAVNLTKTQSAIARIANNFTKTQSAIARIAVNLTKTQTAIARIQRVVTFTQTAKARIANLVTKTQTAVARISNNFTKTQTAIARIARNLTFTQSATARIQRILSKTQTSIARISTALTKTQSAIARIANVRTLTQTATARIQRILSLTQSAKARIAVNLTKTQSATARVIQQITKTQTATARIAVKLTKTITATARIIQQPFKTQTATARIMAIATKLQTARACVANNLSATQSATARIQTPSNFIPIGVTLGAGQSDSSVNEQDTSLTLSDTSNTENIFGADNSVDINDSQSDTIISGESTNI